MRAAATGPIDLGITLNLSPAVADTDSELDRAAARRSDGLANRIYLDPLRYGRYPADVVADLAARGVELPVQPGDLEVIASPIDVLGVNYYTGHQFSGRDEDGRSQDPDGNPVQRSVARGLPTTAMGWEIFPEGLTDLLVRISRDYPGVPLMITESGAAFDDKPDDSGFVGDDDRTAYLAAHIAAVAAARQAGADVRGYFVWSLLDNFEWGEGYGKRFGIVRVDYDTQARIPKQSALWYRETVRRVRGGGSA
ncbi:MAG TPA: family 1 glycosylhydrolase, partial [Micromonosporaceae bacterium]|nr:family 1 glycosylhydrolase [Micromonosporaceae bacterium]